ncbi:MAG: MATE family efflux transporter [Clostridia bacterium]|nr:MATE family efflux transporter [Clostridia bacterium]
MEHNGKVLDMTQGKPMRKILAFAIPLFIGNIFQQVYSMVDTMVAGYCLGDRAIAAIGATAALYGLILSIAWGLNSGFALVATQSFGAHNVQKLRKAIGGMMVLDGAVTVLLTALSLLFLPSLMRLMNTPESIFDQAYSYMAIICAGMMATICYNMFAGILRSFGNSRTPLYFLIFSSLLNIALDLLFVAVLGMGVGGAALATVAAQAVSGIMTGVYVYRHYREMMPRKADFRPDRQMLRELLSTGAAMAFMYSVVDLGSVAFQGANNALGEVVIASHTAARRIITILMQPMSTIMDASGTFVAQNWGAQQKKRIRVALKEVMGMEIAWGLFSCLVVYLFGRAMVHFTTGTVSEEILGNAVMSLRIHFPFFPVLGVLLALRVSMQSMGQKTAPVLSSVIELLMKILAAVWLIPKYGFVGTCVTEPVTWVLMTTFLLVVYGIKTRKLLAEDEPVQSMNVTYSCI